MNLQHLLENTPTNRYALAWRRAMPITLPAVGLEKNALTELACAWYALPASERPSINDSSKRVLKQFISEHFSFMLCNENHQPAANCVDKDYRTIRCGECDTDVCAGCGALKSFFD